MGKKSCQQPDERLDSPDLESSMTMNSQRIATIDVASTDGTFSSHRRRFMENKEKSRRRHLQASDKVGLFHNRNHGSRGRALARHPAKRQRSWQELAVRLARRQPQPLGQPGVSPTVLIVQHKVLANARKNLFIRNSFSNHVNWNDKNSDSEC